MRSSALTSSIRGAGIALAALLACTALPQALGAPSSPDVEVSLQLARLTPMAVVDYGVGVIEAEGVSTSVQPPPAIQAAREARQAALDELGTALLLVPIDGANRIADLPDEQMERVLEAAGHATIVAEWRDDDGHIHAICRMPLFLGEHSLLSACLVPSASSAPIRAGDAPRPALIILIEGEEPVEFGLLPRLLPHGSEEPMAGDPWECISRDVRPVTYADDLPSALALLAEDQPSVVLAGRPVPEARVDIRLALDTEERLATARLPLSYEAIDRVVLVVHPPAQN